MAGTSCAHSHHSLTQHRHAQKYKDSSQQRWPVLLTAACCCLLAQWRICSMFGTRFDDDPKRQRFNAVFSLQVSVSGEKRARR